MLAHTLFFYFFSTIAVLSALLLTISKNTIYSVFFLILVFVTVSMLFIMIGAEFIGMIMLIVYVGAVAVLFLFVVMMLNISEKQIEKVERKGFLNNISIGAIVGLIIFFELIIVVGGWKYKGTFKPISSIDLSSSNTHALGNILYTDYIHLFQLAGIILLVAMIGAITLTFKKRQNIKRQSYFTQIQREKSSAVALIDVENSKGVKIDD
jgi:NADH-quinone oxidoreductase subunit J